MTDRVIPLDEVIGKLPYACDCGDLDEVEVTMYDFRKGSVLHECSRTGGKTEITLREVETELILETTTVNGLNQNYPDGFAGID